MKSAIRVCLYCALLLLAGCSSIEERQERVENFFQSLSLSGTGGVSRVYDLWEQVLEAGNGMADGIESLVEEAEDRVQKVQSGATMILEGKRLIEEGMKKKEIKKN